MQAYINKCKGGIVSLKNFANSNNFKSSNSASNSDTIKEKIPKDVYEKNHKSVENLYNEYKGYSKDELTEMLYEQVKRDKANGSFDINKIENSLNMIMPYVSESQKNNLKNLLNKIR